MNAVVQIVERAPMVIVDLEQGSDAWLEWRKEGIGASEAPTVMGENPWQTPAQLWAQRVGLTPEPDFSGNPHVQRGRTNEGRARELFEKDFGEFAVPLLGEHPEVPYIRASFDGILSTGAPLEIKCPAENRLEQVRLFAQHREGMTDPLVQGDLNEMGMGHYYGQLQQQALVADSEGAFLYVYDAQEDIGYGFWVAADVDYQQRLIEALHAFWGCVQDQVEPELDPVRDAFTPDRLIFGDDDLSDLPEDHPWLAWVEAEEKWLELDKQIKAFEAEIKELAKGRSEAQEKMVDLMGGHLRAKGRSGLQVARFTRRGSVNYRKALTELAPDITEAQLEAYRGNSSQGVRMTPPKD